MRILVLGTSSDAGKTVCCAMICRYLSKRGMDPVPFKAFNLSLNSYATKDGGEIGIGQAFQAWACGVEPETDMNPVLLKPSGNGKIQAVIAGKPFSDIGADRSTYQAAAREEIPKAYSRLASAHGCVICEGSGSPAELNLMQHDLANTGLMRMIGVPAVLVGDIERGGVFAAIYGTWRLIPDDVRPLVRGFFINRFRGEPSILREGIEKVEELTGMRCLGVLPYLPLRFPEEDSLSQSEGRMEGEDPRQAFMANVDTLLEAAEASGFDFEALIRMSDRGSSAGGDPQGPHVGRRLGVHGHRPAVQKEDEGVRRAAGRAHGVLYRRSRGYLHGPVLKQDARHGAPIPCGLFMIRPDTVNYPGAMVDASLPSVERRGTGWREEDPG
ncbi:MAG: cobyric acid synthase [Thermoplasmata archaeon]|nr:cobyric acid synthase [Thermoplasmata archaeon]